MPAYGSRRARAERPRARRTPFEGGMDPRARRSLLEVSEPPRTGRSPPEGGAHPRARRSLLEGIFEWAVGVSAAWAVSCMVKRGVFGFGFVAGFKWGFPSCLRGPLGLSLTGSIKEQSPRSNFKQINRWIAMFSNEINNNLTFNSFCRFKLQLKLRQS
jgi:hypothetical protein